MLSPARIIAMQRGAGNAAVARMLQRQKKPTDQHAGTHLPNQQELAIVDKAVNPTAPKKAGGKAAEWDGEKSNADWQANREALKQELTEALDKYFAPIVPWLAKVKAAPKIPLQTYEGPGRAAKRLVDDKFGAYASAAALTKPQSAARADFSFKAGEQLRDRTDPKQFEADPWDTGLWIAQTDKACAKVQAAHGLNKDRSKDEFNYLYYDVVGPWVGAHYDAMTDYDRYGFASSGAIIDIAPVMEDSKRFPAKSKSTQGAPSRSERHSWWGMWEILVHEYIHTLEHPAFIKMRDENRILLEGFCEMYTEEVLREAIPIAKADSDPLLRGEVEGKDDDGKLWHGFTDDLVPPYSSAGYHDYAARSKEIKATLGENAVRAAYFQGHIELIGLGPDGKVAAAPGAKDQAPPGFRYHRVVEGVPLTRGDGAARIETAHQIATQNGLTLAELKAANPNVKWDELKPGDNVLIPITP